jgi:uncharacterized membrane protein
MTPDGQPPEEVPPQDASGTPDEGADTPAEEPCNSGAEPTNAGAAPRSDGEEPNTIGGTPTSDGATPGEATQEAPSREEAQRGAEEPPSTGRGARRAFFAGVRHCLSTPDRTSLFPARDIREHRGMAVLCYLWILWVIPLFRARDSRYVRYHLGQGLMLLLLDCLGATFFGIAYFTDGFLPVAAPAFWALAEVALLLSLSLKLFGVVGAARGQARELPLVGAYSPRR